MVGWTLGVGVALAIGAAPAAAGPQWSVGVQIGNAPVYGAYPGPVYGPYYGPVYYPPVYAAPVYYPPVYAAPVYAPPVYRAPVYRAPVYRAPVYRQRVYSPAYAPYYSQPVVVVNGRHDNGRHNGAYKNQKGRGHR